MPPLEEPAHGETPAYLQTEPKMFLDLEGAGGPAKGADHVAARPSPDHWWRRVAFAPSAEKKQAGDSVVRGNSSGIVRGRTNDSELVRLADKARRGFKRPSWWVLIFGWSLAACAGSVNSISFRSFGHFVSHATGGTTSIALGLEGVSHGRHGWEEPADAAKMIASFVTGAFACGLLIDKNQVRFGGKALYGVALVGNALLLLTAVLVFEWSDNGMLGACTASCACGLQNAMCTSHFGAVIRTTHVTGTLTDIGSTVGRMAMIFLRKRCRSSRLNVLEHAEVGVDAKKLLVLGPMWLSFFFGTMVGAYTWTRMGVYAMLMPASLTFFVGLAYTLFRPQMKSTLKRIEQNRLRKELEEISCTLSRSQSFIMEARARSKSWTSDEAVADLEEEFGLMLQTMQQVEAQLEDFCQGQEEQNLNLDSGDDEDDDRRSGGSARTTGGDAGSDSDVEVDAAPRGAGNSVDVRV